MSIKLIAIDIDGTLVDKEFKITPEVKAAITEAREQGVKIVLLHRQTTSGRQTLHQRIGIGSGRRLRHHLQRLFWCCPPQQTKYSFHIHWITATSSGSTNWPISSMCTRTESTAKPSIPRTKTSASSQHASPSLRRCRSVIAHWLNCLKINCSQKSCSSTSPNCWIS